MNISLTDNGGRRVEGDRRLVDLNNYIIERRAIKERRVAKFDKRGNNLVGNDYPERRALDLLVREKFNFA